MDIALVNSFPRLPYTAEVEYIKRFTVSAAAQGHRVFEVITSDDIHDCRPDFVIATHDFTPKLTPFLTLGALWSPPSYYVADEARIRAITSYDAYLVGSRMVRQFLDDLEFSTGSMKPKSDFFFLPTSSIGPRPPESSRRAFSLAYVGVHWDGMRHAALLQALCDRGFLSIYGPEASWRAYPGAYRHALPFDGHSVIAALAEHGIALCIHKEEHRAADTPSMRLFEAAAAGCLIITDDIPFARHNLGDSAFYLDLDAGAQENVRTVERILQWVVADPAAAAAKAAESSMKLGQSYSLDVQIRQCCDFAVSVMNNTAETHRCATHHHRRAFFGSSNDQPEPALIDVVVRTGGRDVSLLRRALTSIAGQSEGTYRVLLIDYIGRKDVEQLAASSQTSRMAIEYQVVPNTGFRSTSLWAGLKRVKAPFFANLDDDDYLAPDHFASLLSTAHRHPDHSLYYSGAVRVEEDGQHFIAARHFEGPLKLDVPERRELKFLEPFNLVRLALLDNYILSNAFLARSSGLDERTLIDPGLVVSEDVYLYFMLARHGSFKSSSSATAYWNWRSSSLDNSMRAVDQLVWAGEGERLVNRLNSEILYNGLSLRELQQLGRLRQ